MVACELKQVMVDKNFPIIGTKVEGHGTVVDYNAAGFPIVRSPEAAIGHLLEPGSCVRIVSEVVIGSQLT